MSLYKKILLLLGLLSLVGAKTKLEAYEPEARAVEICSFRQPQPIAWKTGLQLTKGDKIFTGSSASATISLGLGVEMELGGSSLVQVLQLAEGKKAAHIFLFKGRVRLRVPEGVEKAKAETSVGAFSVKTGFADIILANLNTLAVSREGSPLEIDTPSEKAFAPVAFYVLVTTEGRLVISKPEAETAPPPAPKNESLGDEFADSSSLGDEFGDSSSLGDEFGADEEKKKDSSSLGDEFADSSSLGDEFGADEEKKKDSSSLGDEFGTEKAE